MTHSRPAGLLLLLIAGGASAQTAPPADVTVSGGATVATDYRFRGLSQTDEGIAIQGTATVVHKSGLYASVWASSIGSYVASGSNAEVDLIAGYRRSFGGKTVDGGVLYYVYPGNGGARSDFLEPYLSVGGSYGPLSAKVGGNVAWRQGGLGLGDGRRGGAYLYGELSAGIPRTPVTVTGHVGHSFVRNAATLGRRYTDWSLQAAYVHRALTFGAAYVDTDTRAFSYPPGAGRTRNVAGAGVVGSVALAF